VLGCLPETSPAAASHDLPPPGSAARAAAAARARNRALSPAADAAPLRPPRPTPPPAAALLSESTEAARGGAGGSAAAAAPTAPETFGSRLQPAHAPRHSSPLRAVPAPTPAPAQQKSRASDDAGGGHRGPAAPSAAFAFPPLRRATASMRAFAKEALDAKPIQLLR
jgi:hypothetical protein